MTITLTREEAQQVLDALQAALSDDQPYIVRCKQTVETLRARLTQPELKWLGLTDDEIRNEAKNHVFDESFFSGAIWARGQIMGKTMDENKPELRSDIDQIYSAVMADTEALEDAKMTLEVIKKTDPGVYDEMIDDTLALIRAALSSSILGNIEKMQKFEKLTKDDCQEIWVKVMVDTKGMTYLPIYEFAKAIESKIIEKNK